MINGRLPVDFYLFSADDLAPVDGVLLDEAVGHGGGSPGHDSGRFPAGDGLDVGGGAWHWKMHISLIKTRFTGQV